MIITSNSHVYTCNEFALIGMSSAEISVLISWYCCRNTNQIQYIVKAHISSRIMNEREMFTLEMFEFWHFNLNRNLLEATKDCHAVVENTLHSLAFPIFCCNILRNSTITLPSRMSFKWVFFLRFYK